LRSGTRPDIGDDAEPEIRFARVFPEDHVMSDVRAESYRQSGALLPRRGQVIWRLALVTVVLASALTLAYPSLVAATPSTTATGSAFVTSRTITSLRQVGPYTILTSIDTLVLTGTIQGTATEPDVLVIGPEGRFTFVGEITGTIAIEGRSGSVVAGVAGRGTSAPVLTADARYHLLRGTGELSGLHLDLTSHQAGAAATYWGEYRFDR
jgi:hypothetical protein